MELNSLWKLDRSAAFDFRELLQVEEIRTATMISLDVDIQMTEIYGVDCCMLTEKSTSRQAGSTKANTCTVYMSHKTT